MGQKSTNRNPSVSVYATQHNSKGFSVVRNTYTETLPEIDL
jgi:hypothetical protein